MSRQVIGAFVELASLSADNGVPSGNDGIRLCDEFLGVAPFPIDWLIRLTFDDAADSADFYLWGKAQDGVWGTIGVGDGQLDEGNTIIGTVSLVKYYPLQDLGLFDRIYLQMLNSGGIDLTSDLAPVYNKEENGVRS